MSYYVHGSKSILGDLLNKFKCTKKLVNILGFVLQSRNLKTLRAGSLLTLGEKQLSRKLWLKYVQAPMVKDLENLVKGKGGAKVSGPLNICLHLWMRMVFGESGLGPKICVPSLMIVVLQLFCLTKG